MALVQLWAKREKPGIFEMRGLSPETLENKGSDG
jgi:hypothetical protein